MAISKVEIKKFTVFEDIAIEFCGGINVIVGENGTGKTHLMKIMYGFVNGKSDKQLFNCEIPGNSFRKLYDSNNNEYPVSDNGVFIPAKDMLTHSKWFPAVVRQKRKEMPFDDTLMDVIDKSLQAKDDVMPQLAISIIPIIEKIIGGKVVINDDVFYTKKENGDLYPFYTEAEGIKKIGLLWQLLMNGSITENTILFWDEPESNINPMIVPDIVDILLELSRHGVQIFAATHDFSFAEYVQLKKKTDDEVSFTSLYKDEGGSINVASARKYRDLSNNPLEEAEAVLYNAVIEKSMEG